MPTGGGAFIGDEAAAELEARYRRLFAAYPREHRASREDEMVATLLDVAEPGQRGPTRREAASIVANGLTTRARSADEWRLGLRLAGLLSLGLATMLGVAAAGLAALPAGPPLSDQIGVGRNPLPLWGVALAAVALAALGRRHRWRIVGPMAVAAIVVVGGGALMGPRRAYLVPFALFLVLATLSGWAPVRSRAVAASAGWAAGAWWLYRFSGTWFEDRWGPGYRVDRWTLSYDLVPLGRPTWWAFLAVGLAAGLVRARFGVATLVIAVPLGLLTVGSHYTGGISVVMATVAAFALALAAGAALRGWTRPRPAGLR